jgi:hypothetical protein
VQYTNYNLKKEKNINNYYFFIKKNGFTENIHTFAPAK